MTFAGTLVASYFIFAGSKFDSTSNKDVAVYEQALKRINTLEQQVSLLNPKLMALTIENLQLKQLLGQEIDEIKLMRAIVDSFPFPTWVKYKDDNGEIRMLTINNSYEFKFGISKAKYEQQRDVDIWPAAIANEFLKNDLFVLQSKRFINVIELVPTINIYTKEFEDVPYQIWKFYFKFLDGTESIIGIAQPIPSRNPEQPLSQPLPDNKAIKPTKKPIKISD